MKKYYYSVNFKFWLTQLISFLWVLVAVALSLPWVRELSTRVGTAPAIFIITFIAYIPGYLIIFAVISLLLDRQPELKPNTKQIPITILIAAFNEENNIERTLQCINAQDYYGKIKIILVDNNSTDKTHKIAEETAKDLNMDMKILTETTPGKSFALNRGLKEIDTKYFITVDADTLLHRKAVKNIVYRILQSPKNVCAVSGRILTRNSRKNWLTKLQEWDYFLGIGAIKVIQGLYQGTLVAQGAFSLYKTSVVREIGGWPNAIGEDIVLTWRFFENDYLVYHEPRAIAFTEVPIKLSHFTNQRSRWARGMIEGLKTSGPLKHTKFLSKYLTAIDILIPIIDLVYTFIWIPGLILALFGKYYIVGPYTLLVLPLSFTAALIMYHSQIKSFNELGLTVRKNFLGFMGYILFFQMMASPISVYGYFSEALNLKKVWK